MTRGAVIAAVRLDAAAIGIDGVDFRECAPRPERISSVEQDSAVMKHIGGEGVRRDVRELASGFPAGPDLNYEAPCNLARINDAIVGQIERTDAVFVAWS